MNEFSVVVCYVNIKGLIGIIPEMKLRTYEDIGFIVNGQEVEQQGLWSAGGLEEDVPDGRASCFHGWKSED